MKLTVLQENLKRGLATVGHAVAGKSTLPVLANVLLRADDAGLTLSATNLEVGITHWIGAQIQEHGAVTLPAKLLADVIGNLPNDRVTLTLDAHTQTVKVECGRFTSNIKGIDAEEFPTIPTVAGDGATLPAALLREAISLTAFAAASDDSRPVLAGVLLVLDKALTLSAADGFRLARYSVALPEPVDPMECIIPARALDTLGRLISGDDPVRVALAPGGAQIAFATDTTSLVSRLIDGKFPDVERIIPQQYATRTVADVADLTKAVKLASYFAGNSQNVLKLTMEPGAPARLVVSANAADVGDNTGEVEALVAGEGGQIALNVKYLSEALAAIGGAQIAIETQTPASPGVLRGVGRLDGYVHIIMPMSIR